jgi:uncharacterized protein (TIGR01244 family)
MSRAIAVVVLLLTGLAQAATAAEIVPGGQLQNLREPQRNRIVSGSIDAADIGRLRAAGIKHIINLRTAAESEGFDEKAIAAGLGIQYHAIPIAGAQSLTKENAAKLDELLEQIGDEPTLVHCGSGNRVGALIAVRAAWIDGRPTEAAIAEGKRWGLTSLEGAVRSVLTNGPNPEHP